MGMINTICAIFLVSIFWGCERGQNSNLNDEYSYETDVTPTEYQSDVLDFTSQIRTMIKERKGPFYQDKYGNSTRISIDTIFYNSTASKACLISILEISNSELEKTFNAAGTHFDARGFLATRSDSASRSWNLRWFRVYNLDRYESRLTVSRKMRLFYLQNLKAVGNSEVKSLYRYNVGDHRFWDSPVWSDSQMLELHESGD